MNENTNQKIKAVYDKVHDANSELYEIWKEDILFGWQWWIEFIFFIIPWIFWIIVRKKNSTNRLLFAGFIILIISSWLDFLGTVLGLWYYSVNLIPTVPAYLVYDFTILPILTMSLIQFFPLLHPFFKACIYAGINSFIGEPLFNFMGFYYPIKWEYIYSFPIFLIMYLISHYLSQRGNFESI